MGIAPLIAAALPALAPLAGDLLGSVLGTGKGSTPNVASMLGSVGGSLNIDSIKSVIQSLLSTLPGDIKNELRSVLAEIRDSSASKEDLARNIQAAVAPQLALALKNLQNAQLQREATSEHNALVKSDERHRLIIEKLNDIDNKINAYRQNTRRTLAAFGAPNV